MKLAALMIFAALTLSCTAGMSNAVPEGRGEAIQFAKLLIEQQAKLNDLNSSQNLLTERLKPWAAKISSSGGMEPERQEAIEFWKKADFIAQGLRRVVAALKNADLKSADNQTSRSNLVTALQSRQEDMEHLTNFLKGCVDNLNGSTPMIPNAITQVTAKLNSMKAPTDTVAPLITDLRTRFSITDSELAK